MEQYHETILVVEDDVQIRNFICYALKAEGFTCLTAGNAAAAMKLLVMEQADMMLLDLGLPDMDGRRFSKRCGNGRKCLSLSYPQWIRTKKKQPCWIWARMIT